jgi:hypothetical protein
LRLELHVLFDHFFAVGGVVVVLLVRGGGGPAGLDGWLNEIFLIVIVLLAGLPFGGGTGCLGLILDRNLMVFVVLIEIGLVFFFRFFHLFY